MRQAGLRKLFLLSPASTAGRRARILCAPRAGFALAERVRAPEGAPIGEVFAFLSGLYFRGKLSYARAFAGPDAAIRIITSNRGLVAPELCVTVTDLQNMSRCDIDLGESAYRTPLEQDAERLARRLAPSAEVVLLGSIATDKYAGILQRVFGDRLKFPETFVGRGDMSRGGLLLRAARSDEELSYQPLAGAVRHGKRPAKLSPLKRGAF